MFTRPDEGTVQGSIISPMLGNIYLHNVLDKWFEEQIKPRLWGEATLIRYCDDFIICFERVDDAKRVENVLHKRFEKYHLSLHPEKTRLIDFKRPPLDKTGGKGPGNFDFLGFTMYWRRNRKGPGWHLACKTRSARLSQTVQAIYDFCRRQRHEPVFIIEEDDSVHKLSHAAFERLIRQDPKECLTKYAGQKIRYALIAVQMKNRKPVDILHTEESFFNFDSNGRLDFSDRKEMIELVFDSLPPIGNNRPKKKIVDARHHFAKKNIKESSPGNKPRG